MSTSNKLSSKSSNYKVKENSKYSNENKQKNNENENRRYTIYKYSSSFPLLEAVVVNNISCFLQIIDKKPILLNNIDLDDLTLSPPQDKSGYLSKEYSFSSIIEIEGYIERAKKENLDTLYTKAKNVWKKYFATDKNTLNLCAADTIFTYFQDKLGMTHYLIFVGDNSTGKSNALRILEYLGYRPMFDISITPANIYNFLGRFEEGQGIILEDEIDNIENHEEKMRIYKAGYVSGSKVTRMYDMQNENTKDQKRYNTFGFKAFSSERHPGFYKAKGFNERLFTIKCSPGNPPHDITEIVNDAGDIKHKKLLRELEDLRKLLFIYRILNHDKPIPDISLSLKNRDKQLCKPLLRLFQNTKATQEITEALLQFISEKKNIKRNSIDAFLYSIVLDIVINRESNHGPTQIFIPNDVLWNVVLSLPGSTIPNKPYSYQTDEFGIISKFQITKISEDKFGAKQGHDGKQRGLIFDREIIQRLSDNYSIIEKIEITNANNNHNNPLSGTNTFNTFNTFWNTVERKGTKVNEITGKNTQVHPQRVARIEVNSKPLNERLLKTHDPSLPDSSDSSVKVLNSLEVLEKKKKETEDKIKERGLYRKWPRSDTWACPQCNDTGDKWHMIDHICKKNKKEINNIFWS